MATTDDLCRSFLDLWWHFDPAAATRAGAVEHDSRLGSFDADTLREHVAALRSIAAAVEAMDIAEIGDEIDRTALLDHLRVQHFRFEFEHPWRRNPALWVEHAADALDGLIPLAAADPQAQAALRQRVADLPRFLSTMVATLRHPSLPALEIALQSLEGLSRLLLTCTALGDARDQPADTALQALARCRSALQDEIAPDPSPHGAAIGEDEVNRRLHHEHASGHNAGELWRAALRQAAEVEAQVVALAVALDPARPWPDVYQRRLADLPPAGDWTAVLGFALKASEQHAAGHGLAVPEEAGLVCVGFPPHRAVLGPGAAYCPAGPRSPAVVRAGAMDPLAVPWVAVQLGAPGLHLHHARRARLSGAVRRHIASSSTPLGWGLYAIDWMASVGYAPAPELRLACGVHLLGAVHLALADLGLHIRRFTTEEAIDHLVGRLPIDRSAAQAEVRRIVCRPLESCAALLGRRELLRLREDQRAARGAGFDLAAFHQAVFSYGGLPVPLMRWGMGLDG